MTEILLGSILVPDLAAPRPQDVDQQFLWYRMGTIRRFTGHPSALFLAEHLKLTGAIAEQMGLPREAVIWAKHHDCHEFATGDLTRPLQKVIGPAGLDVLQARWDVAICAALGIPQPSTQVRAWVSIADTAAMAMEWRYCLGRDIAELRVSKQIELLSDERDLLNHVLCPARREEIAYGHVLLGR